MRRWLTLAALCVAFFAFTLLPATPAHAARLSACTRHRGTVVAVDFGHWGGPIARGCGIDEPSGYALLHAAGFTVAGDAHDGAAFICRIGNQAFDGGTMHPTASEDSCNGTPSTSAYWSYWLAPPGQSHWTYSPIGPMGDVPKPGEVELWMFGATNVGGTRGSGVPRFPPSSLRAATGSPTKRTPTRSTTAPATATRVASARVRTSHRSKARPQTAPGRRQPQRRARKGRGRNGPVRKRTRAPAPGRRVAAGSGSVASVRRPRPMVVSAQPMAAHTSSGSAGPLVVGLLLAVALSAGATWAVRRRRRYE